MSKFVIECPHCGSYQEVKNGFFARKVVPCKCGEVIDVKKDRFSVRECPHCGNNVIYDQAKGEKAVCPVCKEKLITSDSNFQFVTIHCPSCACSLTTNKNAEFYECPLCDKKIDVQKEAKKEAIKSEGNASVIKYEGPNNVLVWKHPIEDFNLGSQLIVHESQEAIFFRDGEALDSFGAGRYTLTTEKLPLLNNLYKLPLDNKVVFHSEVYFINMVTQMAIKWGTDSKVRLFDPASGLHVELGASGEFSVKVSHARKLLIKLVGTTSELRNTDLVDVNPYSLKSVTGKFRALIVSKVKSLLAKTIRENNINILEIDEHIQELSELLKNAINPTLVEYGLVMPEFFVTTIVTPDDDPNFKRLKEQYAEQYLLVREEQIKKNVALAAQQRKIVEAQTGAQEEIIAAQGHAEAYRLQAEAEAKEMQMKGYTYQQETQRKVGLAAMENLPQGGSGGQASGVVGDIVGLGVTLGAVGSVMGMTKEAMNPIANQAQEMGKGFIPNGWNCSCGTTNITTAFCPNCGNKKPDVKVGWTCPNCGKQGITSMFCPDCGTKKEPDIDEWDCECGEKSIKTKFCPNCGKPRGDK